MSDRERWIVYPLLFLALGAALRDKLARSIHSVDVIRGAALDIDLKRGSITCRSLILEDDRRRRVVQLRTEQDQFGGAAVVYGSLATFSYHHQLPSADPAAPASDPHPRRVETNRIGLGVVHSTGEIRCRKLQVVDPFGRERISLAAEPHEADQEPQATTGRLWMQGPDDQPRIVLSAEPRGGRLSLLSADATQETMLGVLSQGSCLGVQNFGEPFRALTPVVAVPT